MRAVLQRVSYGKVTVENQVVASIGKGLVILLGVGPEDTIAKAEELAEKCSRLRIFEDDAGKMNLSLLDVKGEVIVVSQFTLYADTSRGRSCRLRPRPHRTMRRRDPDHPLSHGFAAVRLQRQTFERALMRRHRA